MNLCSNKCGTKSLQTVINPLISKIQHIFVALMLFPHYNLKLMNTPKTFWGVHEGIICYSLMSFQLFLDNNGGGKSAVSEQKILVESINCWFWCIHRVYWKEIYRISPDGFNPHHLFFLVIFSAWHLNTLSSSSSFQLCLWFTMGVSRVNHPCSVTRSQSGSSHSSGG